MQQASKKLNTKGLKNFNQKNSIDYLFEIEDESFKFQKIKKNKNKLKFKQNED